MAERFSQKTGDFLWELALNNERPWFHAHKEAFEQFVNQPLKELAAETLERLREKYPEEDFGSHICRIYRDARRLYGRGPFKEHMWFTIKGGDPRAQGPAFWFEINPSGCAHGMGTWDMTAAQAQTFRDKIDANPARFEQMVGDIASRGEYRLWSEEYKRPKGDRGALLNPWYNRKSISVGWEYGYEADVTVEKLLADFDALMPMYHFLKDVYFSFE